MKTLFLLFALGFICLEASQQSVAVNGWIRCKDKYLGGITIKLWDQDTLDPDDLMSEGVTGEGGPDDRYPLGYFNISGTTTEITKIDPQLRIYHSCTDGDVKPICSKVIIPQSYITDNSDVAKKVYNAEVITLEDKVNDCV